MMTAGKEETLRESVNRQQSINMEEKLRGQAEESTVTHPRGRTEKTHLTETGAGGAQCGDACLHRDGVLQKRKGKSLRVMVILMKQITGSDTGLRAEQDDGHQTAHMHMKPKIWNAQHYRKKVSSLGKQRKILYTDIGMRMSPIGIVMKSLPDRRLDTTKIEMGMKVGTAYLRGHHHKNTHQRLVSTTFC